VVLSIDRLLDITLLDNNILPFLMTQLYTSTVTVTLNFYISLFELRNQMNTSSLSRYCQKFKYLIILRYLILHLALKNKFIVGCVLLLYSTILGFMIYQNCVFVS